MRNLKFKIFFVFSLLYLFSPTKVEAQSLGLSIYPPLLEVMIKPGKSITQVYKLTNEGETDLLMTSKIVPFEPADELGNIVIRDTGNEIRNYFSFQNADLALGQNFTLKAGSQQQIVLRIDIPQQAKEDDYYLTLLFETNPQENLSLQPGGISSAQAKIGANILLTVSETGEPPRKAEITEFKIKNSLFKIGSWQFLDSFTNPVFVLRLKNSGRSLFKPMGTITTTGWLGQKYFSDLLPENVLIKSIRQVQCDQIKPKFLFGPYQAKANFGLDKISEDYQQTLHFFAFPFSLTAGLLFLILIFYLIKKYSRPKDILTTLSKNYQMK